MAYIANVDKDTFWAHVDDPGELRPEDAPATYTWITAGVSESGIVGDATAATPEKGREWAKNHAESLEREILSLCHWARGVTSSKRIR